MSALAGLGAAAQGITAGQLAGLEAQRQLQQTAFAQGQARQTLDLRRQELQLQQRQLDAQELMQGRQILSGMSSELMKTLEDPNNQAYWQGAGKDQFQRINDWLTQAHHAMASGDASTLFGVMSQHPQAAARVAAQLGVPLPPDAQAKPLKPGSAPSTTQGGPGAPVAAQSISPQAIATGPTPALSLPDLDRMVRGSAPAMGVGAPGGAPAAPSMAAPGAVMPKIAPSAPSTIGALAGQAGLSGAAAPPLDTATQSVASLFEPVAGETPQQRETRIATAVTAQNLLTQPQRELLKSWLDYRTADLNRQVDLFKNASDIASREKVAGAEIASREKVSGAEIASRERISGSEIASKEKVAAGEQATQLIGHALTYDAAAASRDLQYDQHYVQNAQAAIRTQIQDGRARAQMLRGQLSALVREDMASQARVTNGVYQSATGSGGVKVGLGDAAGLNAALQETGGSSQNITQTRFYNTPEHLKMLDTLTQLRQMESQTPPFVPRNINEARLLGEPINSLDQQQMRKLVGGDGANAVAFSKTFSQLKTANPAAAIRMVNTYRTMFPNRPLPKGISLASISNPEGQTAAASVTAPAPTAPVAPSAPAAPPIPGALGGLGAALTGGLNEIIKRTGQPAGPIPPQGY